MLLITLLVKIELELELNPEDEDSEDDFDGITVLELVVDVVDKKLLVVEN